MVYPVDPAMHRFGRIIQAGPVKNANPLMTETNTQHRNLGSKDSLRTDTEVFPSVRPARSGREHDIVKTKPLQPGPIRGVVLYYQWRFAVHLTEQVVQVKSERVVVVDYQGSDHRRNCESRCAAETLARSSWTFCLCAAVLKQRSDSDLAPGPPQS